jgi:Mg2+/Co2+ transporter CorB
MSDQVPLTWLFTALAVMLLIAGFFSIAETSMMALNRNRLKHLVREGKRSARLTQELLDKTDRLLGVILLFNNLVNTAAATLVSVITLELFGDESWALGVATLLVTFAILVFSEITPKVIGANHADRLAPFVAYPLTGLLRGTYFLVWFINLFSRGLLALLRLQPKEEASTALSVEELRAMVIDSGQYIPHKHRSMLLNLFDLESITVEDVMTPRGAIESIDLSDPEDIIRRQIATSFHTRLAVYDGDSEHVIGVLHQRRLLGDTLEETFSVERIRELLARPYFVPADTPLYSQIQFFQENQQRLAFVVDEYGEILGLITLEDIIEELIGKFTTSIPDAGHRLHWSEDGCVLVDGSTNLRALNRRLGLALPIDGPKTLNGLILEHLQDIPETGVSMKIGDIPIEVVQTQDRMVRTARIFRPLANDATP